MPTRTRDPKGIKALEIKFRGLAIEDGLWDAAKALAEQVGEKAKPERLRKSASQFPFHTALTQQLRAMQARYGALLEGAPDATIVTNAAGEIILSNARALGLLGHPEGLLLGKSLSTVLTGAAIDALAQGGVDQCLAAAGESAATGLELVGLRGDGSRFPLEAMLSRVDEDESAMLVLSLRDLTVRKRAERRAAGNESHLRQILDVIPDATLVINKRGHVTFANAEARRLLGHGDGDAADPSPETLPPAIIEEALRRMGEADPEAEGPPLAFEAAATSRDGAALRIEARLAVISTMQGPLAIVSLQDMGRRPQNPRAPIEDEALHRQLVDALPDAMLLVAPEGDIVAANRRAEHRFGYGPGELTGLKIHRVLPGIAERLGPSPLISAELELARSIGTGITLEGRRKDGAALPLEVMLGALESNGRRLVIVTAREAPMRKIAEQQPSPGAGSNAAPVAPPIPVAGASPMAEVTLNAIGDALVSADLAGKVSFVNLAAAQLTGWSWQEAAGRPLAEILCVVDSGTRISIHDVAELGGLRRAAQLHPNVVLIRRDGTEVPVEGSIAPIDDRDGRPAGRVLIFRDVSLARARDKQMAYGAHHDALTGLPNRVLLNDRIASAIAIAPRHAKKVAVLFLDLDGFKRINDSLGHAVGDKLLQLAAGRLMTCVRGSDTVSRIGGDEFVLVLSEIERAEDSAISARRTLEALAQPYTIDSHELRVTASIGVAVYPEDGVDAEALIKSADAAMYLAKENGRHGYQFYKPSMNLRAVERQEVEDGLRHALEREEFTLHFQPKVDLHTGRIAGAEALLRWEHPSRGPVPPALFMPVAETSGLIQPIGTWVLREACRQAQAWRAAGLTLPTVAVNVSALEFTATKFLDGVFEILSATGLDPRALELELTESVLMRHAETSNAILQALRAGGVQMSVDDFGTGYSSLNYLRKFPIHMLKIDQSFVREITASEGDASVVTAVLNMAQSLNLKVVAEGVETPEELEFLQLHRCDEAQGYYFSRPLPAAQFTRLLRDGLLRTMAQRQSAGPAEIDRRQMN